MADRPIRNRGGRPTRRQATEKALAGVVIDPATFDPIKVLVEIAADTSAPAAARVSAAKALLAERDRGDDGASRRSDADLNKRALALMRRAAN